MAGRRRRARLVASVRRQACSGRTRAAPARRCGRSEGCVWSRSRPGARREKPGFGYRRGVADDGFSAAGPGFRGLTPYPGRRPGAGVQTRVRGGFLQWQASDIAGAGTVMDMERTGTRCPAPGNLTGVLDPNAPDVDQAGVPGLDPDLAHGETRAGNRQGAHPCLALVSAAVLLQPYERSDRLRPGAAGRGGSE